MTSGDLISFVIYKFLMGGCMENLSFTLYPGKVTALVGPSGSGNSSCVNILESFYPVQDGEVLLDVRPINMYDHKYLYLKISLVSKEPVLFAHSIENNISYGLNSVPLGKAHEVNRDLLNHTVLIVAHRLSTVEKVHNIIVLAKGRMVQQENHSEQMEQGGLYSHLVHRQVSAIEPASEE